MIHQIKYLYTEQNHKMEVAIAEPHFYGIHGGTQSLPHYMVVYSYSLDEFYNHEWQDDYKVVLRNVRQIAHRLPYQHDLIRGTNTI